MINGLRRVHLKIIINYTFGKVLLRLLERCNYAFPLRLLRLSKRLYYAFLCIKGVITPFHFALKRLSTLRYNAFPLCVITPFHFALLRILEKKGVKMPFNFFFSTL